MLLALDISCMKSIVYGQLGRQGELLCLELSVLIVCVWVFLSPVDPIWASISLGVTLCIDCSGIHR